MEYLPGGRENKIARVANTVHRPAGPWTRSVHALLRHVRAVGFTAVPEPLGFDEAGNEIVTFLAGEVCNYPLSAAAASEEALVSAAQLLRAYHEATVSFLTQNVESHTWQLPTQTPIEVICHGDFAPYNVVLNGRQAVGIIDFDTAHPGPRSWDIAYALYRWAPFTHPQNPDGLGDLETQIGRARLFCDAYGFPAAQRAQPGRCDDFAAGNAGQLHAGRSAKRQRSVHCQPGRWPSFAVPGGYKVFGGETAVYPGGFAKLNSHAHFQLMSGTR